MGTVLALLGLGTLVGMDLVSVGQLMIARPLVAGTLAGAILGDAGTGLMVGVLLELFALDVMPVGAVRYPDYGIGAVVAAATAVQGPNALGVGFAVALGLLVAYVGEKAMVVVRRRNSQDVRGLTDRLDAGDLRAVEALQYRGVLRDALRALLLTGGGIAAAHTLRLLPPITTRGAVLLAVGVFGAAIGTAAAGAMRLSGRGLRLKWLTLGVVAGTAWVLIA